MIDRENIERLNLELSLARLKSHEKHMSHIYGIRWAGLILSAISLLIGSIMVFLGLEGSFNWAIETPSSISAKLTNASPGIVFASTGLLIALFVLFQKPVSYTTGGGGGSSNVEEEKLFPTSNIRRNRNH